MSVSLGAVPSPQAENVGVIVIHGVGETQAGWINDALIPRLSGHPGSPAFQPFSEVHDLPDLGRNREGRTFEAYIRRGVSAGGNRVAFLELTWADLSRIGTGTLASWLMMLKLFYEAPQVLGDCFLDRSQSRLSNAIGTLVRFANRILRWPITGLNTVALVCALALLARQRFVDVGTLKPFLTQHLSFVMAGLLVVLALLSLVFARWRVYRDIALTDIGMSTMVFAGLGAGAILIAEFFSGPDLLSNPATYLQAAGVTIFGFWYAWNYAMFAAIVLLLALAVQQVFRRRTSEKVPIVRPAAAISLSIVQGVLYKIVIALLWVFIFVTLDFNERTEKACVDDPFRACKYLADVQVDLEGIVVFNVLMLALLGLVFFLVAMVRSLMRVPARRMASLAAFRMPRMVVSPAVMAAVMAGTIFNLVIFYWRALIPIDFYDQVNVSMLPWRSVVGYVLGGGSAVTFAFYLFRALQHASRGILHIVRDLVDHQFTPRFTLSRRLLPAPSHNGEAHPRRARIERRLDVLLKDIVDKERFDRLVFVAHSQGSVILHDYLSSHHDEDAIRTARAIDVLTLGSPLSHLYQYYFAKYAAASAVPGALNPRLTSWTNLWRVDDPIGNRIDLIDGGFIRNVPLRPGGHVDYWKERDVLQAIVDLVDGRPVAAGPSPARTEAASDDRGAVAGAVGHGA